MDDPEKELAELQKPQEPLEVIHSSKNRPLKIRIKFPTKNGVCREEDKVEETHVQQKDQTTIELKNHLPSSSMEEESQIQTECFPCSDCRKIFPSRKSLYGHMRLHSNKLCRGITTPSNSMMLKIDYQRQNSTSSSGSGRSDIYSLQHLMRWPVTGKRGRKSKEQLERDISEAADGLLMLPNGNSLDLANKDYIERTRVSEDTLMAEIESTEKVVESSELPKKRRIEEAESENLELQCKKAKTDKEIENSRPWLNPELVKSDSGLLIPNGFGIVKVENAYLLYGVPSNGMPFKSGMLMKKFCKSGKMNYNIETPMSPKGFSCDECGKSFPSHQALGGHKSGHRNDKNRIHNAGSENLSLHGESLEFKPSMSKNNVRTHQCKICNVTFESGQALGGHQRLHRPKASPTCSDSSPDKTTKESSITSASPPENMFKEYQFSSVSSPERFFKEPSNSSVALLEEVSCKTVHNRVEFDLNELPPDNDYCF